MMDVASEVVMNELQAAEFLGVKRSCLQSLRVSDVKPPVPHFFIGRKVRYCKKNLLEWAQGQVKPKRIKKKNAEAEIVRVS